MTSASASNSSTTAALIEHHQAIQGLTDLELANAIGYDKGVVISMIKKNSMRLPINKVSALARALCLDARDVLRAVLTEQVPGLLATLEEVFGPLKLTGAEVNLIEHLRRMTAGRETAPIVFEGTGVIALVVAGQEP